MLIGIVTPPIYCHVGEIVIFKHFFSERSAAVDSSGREFNRNRLIALLSAIVLEQVRDML